LLRLQPTAKRTLTLDDGRNITLLDCLGRGSSGTVFRGIVDSSYGVQHPVAVKMLEIPREMDVAFAMDKLAAIVQRGACVNHPAVARVYEVGQSYAPFVVSELVEGESLASIIAGWHDENMRVPIDFALVVGLRVAEGLAGALFTHDLSGAYTALLHGDLAPQQVLVSYVGEVKITDFGQRSLRDGLSDVRSVSRLAYTAPEILRGGTRDARTDVFALGAMLHEMLIAPRFAKGTSIADAVRLVEAGTFPASVLEPNLPRSLRDVVEHAIAEDPDKRYPHAQAMAFDLRREMLRLGLCDAQTSVRNSVVGWCEVKT
jgi:serine/threonine protein kinase